MERERFNLTFSDQLLRELRQISHDAKMQGKRIGINALMEQAVSEWLENHQHSMPIPAPKRVSPIVQNVVNCTHSLDPFHRTVERILRSTEAEGLRSYVRYVGYYVATHLESLPADERESTIDDLAEAIENESIDAGLYAGGGIGESGQPVTEAPRGTIDRVHRSCA